MKQKLSMQLGGLLAIAFDCAIVASMVSLLLLTRWIGVGGMFDLLTVLFVCYMVLVWLYGTQVAQFLNHFFENNAHQG
jgi:hypothetical protein